MYKIKDIIESRPDGSYIYMSYKGVLNLDSSKELKEAQDEDNSFLNYVR